VQGTRSAAWAFDEELMEVPMSVPFLKSATIRSAVAMPVLALMLAAPPASAQTQGTQTQGTQTPPSTQSLENRGDCNSANKAEAATAPNRQAADGTSPGNSGSTGWTGGTGGAYMGTNPQGALPESRTWQPPTARGLDLAMAPPSEPTANTASGQNATTGTPGC
jgi:hypothetical protein